MLEIVQLGHPILRGTTQALTVEEILSPKIQSLIKAMQETMRAAPGVGLAAPQVGLALQLAVIEDPLDLQQKYFSREELQVRNRGPVPFQVIINPKLRVLEAESVDFFEGCLSFKGFVGVVPRAKAVQIECLNEHAVPVSIKAEGWYARILQHEIDHLEGRVCIDRMYTRSLCTLEHYQNFWRAKDLSELKALLKF